MCLLQSHDQGKVQTTNIYGYIMARGTHMLTGEHKHDIEVERHLLQDYSHENAFVFFL